MTDHGASRPFGRREVLALAGTSAGAVALASFAPPGLARWMSGTGAAVTDLTTGAVASAQTPPACVVRPAQTEGPYFVDERLDRSDIRADPESGEVSEGTRLGISFAVSRIDGAVCTPLAGVLVDVWHCDAGGVYSDVEDAVGQKFLRGYQVTGSDGLASFTTVYPGWYPGRAVHIHFKIRTDPDASDGYEFTSQVYFDDTLTDTVFTNPPYAARGTRTTRNDGDGIYQNGGENLLLALTSDGTGGYTTVFPIALALPSSGCAGVIACLASLDAALPRAATAATGAARRSARRLRARFAKAARLLRRGAETTGGKQTKRFARASAQLQQLSSDSRAANERGSLGVPLAPIEAAIAALLALAS